MSKSKLFDGLSPAEYVERKKKSNKGLTIQEKWARSEKPIVLSAKKTNDTPAN